LPTEVPELTPSLLNQQLFILRRSDPRHFMNAASPMVEAGCAEKRMPSNIRSKNLIVFANLPQTPTGSCGYSIQLLRQRRDRRLAVLSSGIFFDFLR